MHKVTQAKYGRIMHSICAAFFTVLISLSVQAQEGASEAQRDMDRVEQLFADAMKALNDDELRTARKRFNSLLSTNPSLHRARLELARVYYLSLDYEGARREAYKVLDDPNTPESVQATLRAFLVQIDKDEEVLEDRHRWGGSVYAGLLYDTNVNIGPGDESFELNGNTFTLSPDSIEANDVALALNGNLTHNYSPGVTFNAGEHAGFFVWQSQLGLRHRQYFDEDDFNLSVITGRTGPAWIVPRHWRAGVAVQADQVLLGGSPLALFTSLIPNAAWQWGNEWEVGVEAVLTKRSFDEFADQVRDGDYYALNAYVSRFFPEDDWSVQAGIGYSDFSADASRFSHDGPDLWLASSVTLNERSRLYSRVSWRDYNYEGNAAFFGFPRDEQELRLSVGYEYDIQNGMLEDWRWVVNWSGSNRESNAAIYDYDRHQINIGLARSF